jgi:diguanylate cyclase (GGDEF)-like protein
MQNHTIEEPIKAEANSPANESLTELPHENSVRMTQENLRRLEYRDWSLWLTAIVVMLVLAFGIYSYTLLPAAGKNPFFEGNNFTWGLFGLVLLFGIFAIYKQRVVNRLRRELAGQMNLAAALQTRTELLHKLAILDPLTGLYNRRFATQHLPVELARCERYHHKLTALMFDLRNLKEINDRHTFAGGDCALRAFAAALRRAIRSSDMAIRMGGDEFLVLLQECEEIGVPRVLARMSNLRCEYGGKEIPITFAAGWAQHQEGESSEQLLARADQSLHEDKRTGSAGSQARAIQEQLRQAEKMEIMGRLTSSVAHDFNNLLTIMKGAAELGMNALEQRHFAYQQLEQIQKAAERAANITRQLLAFSRKQVLEPKILNMGSIASAMQMMLQRLLGKEVALTIEAAPDLYEVRADPGQMEQLLINLVSNARDALPRGGRVGITASNCEMDAAFVASHPGARAGQYVRIAVTDNGAGMDAAVQRQIFEPFFTTKEPGKGTGLGLSIVYGVVKQNGGYIWVNSEPGKGTCVAVYLPRYSAEPVATPAAPATVGVSSSAAGSGRRPRSVLVVESFDGLRRLMCDFLNLAGYRAVEAANSEQAIQIMNEEEDIEVMICDIVLPGMSGLELSQCLAEHRNLQVLYISGYMEDTLMYREYLKNTAHVLTAPFTAQDLSEKLQELAAAPRISAGPQVHRVQ